MYTFIINDNGPDLDIIITRAMLALAAIAAIVYHTDKYYFLNLLSAIVLFTAAIFIKLLLVKFRVNRIALICGAAIILLIATHSIGFAVILLIYGYLVKYLGKKPVIIIGQEGITIRKLFGGPVYPWKEFSNIVLKDNVLTLDFKDNKLIQVIIAETRPAVDEGTFNGYCRASL